MSYRLLTLFILCLAQGGNALGQMRQMVWPLPNALDGTKLLLDFHTDPPTLIELPNDPIYGPHESIGSICNRWGELILYSDSYRAWNGSHDLVDGFEMVNMPPEDESVFSHIANGAMVLPFPGDSTDRYFSLLTIRYVGIFDNVPMNLQHLVFDRYGGSTGTGLLLDTIVDPLPLGSTEIQEKLTAIQHANGRDWWIVCRKGTVGSDTLITMLLNPGGIQSISYYKAPLSLNWLGNMKVSLDGTLIAESATNASSKGVLYVHEFDRCIGSIGFFDSLSAPLNTGFYGLAYSNNNRFLYAGTSYGMDLFQVKLAPDSIEAVEQIVDFGNGRFFGHLQMGPNGKIYCNQQPFSDLTDPAGFHFGVIENPDAEGLACGYDPAGYYLNDYHIWGAGFPNHPNYDLGPLEGSPCDTLPDPVIAGMPVVEEVSNGIQVFPNPASAHIYFSPPLETKTVLAYDMAGRRIWEWTGQGQLSAIDCSGWPNGLYTIAWEDMQSAWHSRRIQVLKP